VKISVPVVFSRAARGGWPKNPGDRRGILMQKAYFVHETAGFSREWRGVFPVFVIWKQFHILDLSKSQIGRLMEVED
jgi:hypothetical protein